MKRIVILLSLLAALMIGWPALASDDATGSGSDGTSSEDTGDETPPPASPEGDESK